MSAFFGVLLSIYYYQCTEWTTKNLSSALRGFVLWHIRNPVKKY